MLPVKNQGVKNVSFAENFANILYEWTQNTIGLKWVNFQKSRASR